VHGTGVYSAGVGPKGPALERFLDIKKKILPTHLQDIGIKIKEIESLLEQAICRFGLVVSKCHI
jgi:hypothetical protein